MAAPELTPDGVLIQTYEEIYNEIADGYRAIYGNDIDLDPNSPDGQRVAIEAKITLDVQTFALNLYNSIDPDFAQGLSLDSIIKLSGLRRQPTSLSQVDVTITTDRDLTLPIGYQVQDDIGQIWETDEALNLTTGANTETLFAQNFGAVTALPNTITEPVTIIIGVASVNNAAAATVGEDEETDPEVRVRRNRSLENPSTSTVGGLFSALGNLSGVTNLVIYENDQDAFDFDLLLEGHSLWVVIEGGSVDDIAETMAKNKTAGTGLKGGTISIFEEVITLENGLTQTILHEMNFDRPNIVDLFVRVTAETKTGAAVDVVAIQNAVAAQSYVIGECAVANELYGNVFSAQNGLVATDLEISDDDVIFTDSSIVPDPYSRFSIQASNVIVTVV